MEYPGQVVDNLGRPLAAGVRGLVHSVVGGVRGVGNQVQSALDQPFSAFGMKSSPFRIIHHPVDAIVQVVENAGTQAVNSIEMVAGGVTTGLDTVPQNFDPQTFKPTPPVTLPRMK